MRREPNRLLLVARGCRPNARRRSGSHRVDADRRCPCHAVGLSQLQPVRSGRLAGAGGFFGLLRRHTRSHPSHLLRRNPLSCHVATPTSYIRRGPDSTWRFYSYWRHISPRPSWCPNFRTSKVLFSLRIFFFEFSYCCNSICIIIWPIFLDSVNQTTSSCICWADCMRCELALALPDRKLNTL